MSFETLEIEEEGAVVRVWLARPERRNALDARVLEEVAACFAALTTRFDVRVVVLGGRGPTFSAGADRKSPPGAGMGGAASTRAARHASQLGRRAVEAIEACEAVTLARVQGHAIGGGLALALACDFRIATEDAKLSLPEVDLGVPLTWGAAPRLAREIGAARAREMILLCEPVSGERAERWGLVHRIVPESDLDAAVDDWAARLAAKPEAAVHMTKTQFRAYARTALQGDLTESDGDLLALASRTPTARTSFS